MEQPYASNESEAVADIGNAGCWYIGVFLLAFLVRGIYLLELWGSQLFSVLVVDARKYDAWAQEIAAGNWFGDEVFYQAPFYPYFLAVVYSIFGHDVHMVRVIQVLLGSTSCVLITAAGWRFFSPRVGVVAGVVLALYAPAIYFDALIQKAAVSMFFTCLLLFLLAQMLVKARIWWVVLSGVVLGFFALTRENSLVFVPVVILWMVLHFKDATWLRRVGWVALFGVGMAAVLLPVGFRNRAIGGEFLITTSQLGPNFYIGNNLDNVDGRYMPLRPGRGDPEYERQDSTEIAEADSGRELTPAEVSRYWLNQSLAYIGENPEHWVRLLLKKCVLLCSAVETIDAESIEAYQNVSLLLRGLGRGAHFGVLLPLSVVGLWSTRHQWRRLWLLYLLILSLAGTVVIFFVSARYRMPVALLLAMFSAAGIVEIFLRARGRELRSLAGYAAVLAMFAVLANGPFVSDAGHEAVSLTNQGLAQIGRGELDEAERSLQQALELVPELETAHYGLGNVAYERGELDAAVVHYERAVALRPDYAAAQNHLAATLVELGRTDEAVAHYQLAIAAHPEFADAYFNLGNALRRVGAYDDAVRAYSKALEIDPDHAGGNFNLGVLHAYRKNFRGAAAHLEHVVRLRPGDSAAHRHLGRVLARLSNVEQAIAHLQTAIRLDPKDPDAHDDLGQVLVALRRFEEAEREFEIALEINPDHASAAKKLARLRTERGGAGSE